VNARGRTQKRGDFAAVWIWAKKLQNFTTGYSNQLQEQDVSAIAKLITHLLLGSAKLSVDGQSNLGGPLQSKPIQKHG
jgi:hypothetical protein